MIETKITKEQVKRVAELSRLKITEREEEEFSLLFTETLKYINALNELDTSKVYETYQITKLNSVFMKDSDNFTTLSVEQSLSNANEKLNNLFVTEGVFGK